MIILSVSFNLLFLLFLFSNSFLHLWFLINSFLVMLLIFLSIIYLLQWFIIWKTFTNWRFSLSTIASFSDLLFLIFNSILFFWCNIFSCFKTIYSLLCINLLHLIIERILHILIIFCIINLNLWNSIKRFLIRIFFHFIWNFLYRSRQNIFRNCFIIFLFNRVNLDHFSLGYR